MGGFLSNGKRDISNIDPEAEENLIKRRTQFHHRTHLKLVDKPKDGLREQVVSLKGPAVHSETAHVDIKAVETKDNDSVGKGRNETAHSSSAVRGSSQRKSVKRQKKTFKQKKNQEDRHRPVPVFTGEVKQTSIESFPSADGLLLPLSAFDDSEVSDHSQMHESSDLQKLISPSVLVEKATMRSVCFAPGGAAVAQPKRSRLYHNHERKKLPAGIGKGKLKQSTGSSPPRSQLAG